MAETKPAVQSTTLWASIITAFPLLINEFPDLLTQWAPILTPHTAAVASAVAGTVIFLRRIFSSNKPIEGIVSTPDQ